MALDRRVEIRVRGILVMNWHRFVELGEHVCCWRLQRVDKLSWVGGIVVFNWWEGKVARDGGGLRDMGVLFLGLGLGCGLGSFQRIILD